MTREEAIDLLSEITMYCDFTDQYGDYINDEPYITALDIAIKSLEAEPCEDCISREKVLYEAMYYADRPTDTFIKDVLKQLPSVQPFSRTFEITYRYERKPVEDCVSRESVIEWLKNIDIIKTKNQEDNARRELDDLPSVTPQQKVGKWVGIESLDGSIRYMCDNCKEFEYVDYYNYCPNCGAKMEGEE